VEIPRFLPRPLLIVGHPLLGYLHLLLESLKESLEVTMRLSPAWYQVCDSLMRCAQISFLMLNNHSFWSACSPQLDLSFTDVREKLHNCFVYLEYGKLMFVDDLGVIAEVIVCESFVSKFEANSTQR